MDFVHLLQGLGNALSLTNIAYASIGVFLGQVIGILPGLGPITGLALLVPIVFGMDPTAGLIMLAGVYYGAMFGGAITSILLNTPGDAAAVVTTFDGYPMAKRGEAGRALGIAALSSFIGGTISVLGLTFVMPLLANVALAFGPAEYTMLVLMAFLTVLTFSGRSRIKAIISTLIGLALATVGQDAISGRPRFTFGNFNLMSGVDFAIIAIGLFAVGEILVRVEEAAGQSGLKPAPIKKALISATDARRIARPVLGSSVLGFVVGMLPGAGATIASFMSYALARATSKNKAEFGHGAPEGIAAPEAANNASVGGALVPMLALGVPGSGSTAVLLGAMLVLGLNPGPLFLVESPEIAWTVIASMYVGNIMLLIMNVPLIRVFAAVLYLPYSVIAVAVIVLSAIGAYSLHHNMFDVFVMLIAGAAGYVMKKNDFPMAPLILALVLGTLFESNWRRALLTSQGNYEIFFSSVASLLILAVIAVALLGPLAWRFIGPKISTSEQVA